MPREEHPSPPQYRFDPHAWKVVKEKDGYTTYRQQVKDTPIVAMRFKARFPYAIERVASVWFDHTRAHEWMHMCAEMRLLQRVTPLHYIVQFVGKGQVLGVWPRTLVSDLRIDLDAPAKIIRFSLKAAHDQPVIIPPKFVLGEIAHSEGILRPLGQDATEMDYGIIIDPKGLVPNFVVNLVALDWPDNTVSAMRKQLTKKDLTLLQWDDFT